MTEEERQAVLARVRIRQGDMLAWAREQFGEDDLDPRTRALGLAEEVGEVCRAVLKRSSGVRLLDAGAERWAEVSQRTYERTD